MARAYGKTVLARRIAVIAKADFARVRTSTYSPLGSLYEVGINGGTTQTFCELFFYSTRVYLGIGDDGRTCRSCGINSTVLKQLKDDLCLANQVLLNIQYSVFITRVLATK